MNTQYSCSEKDNWMLAIHAIQGLIEQSIRACFHITLSLVLKYKRVRRVNNWKMEILRLYLGFMSVREIIVLHHCPELVLWRPRRVQPLWQICKHLYRLINLGFFSSIRTNNPSLYNINVCVCRSENLIVNSNLRCRRNTIWKILFCNFFIICWKCQFSRN